MLLRFHVYVSKLLEDIDRIGGKWRIFGTGSFVSARKRRRSFTEIMCDPIVRPGGRSIAATNATNPADAVVECK